MDAKLVFTKPVKAYAPTPGDDAQLSYPRLVEIKHRAEGKGTLLLTGQSLEVPYFKVLRSTDGGESWKMISKVSEQFDPSLVCNWQPHIYELPCKVGDMPAGTVLFSACARDKNTSRITEMCLWKSDDLGETWEEISVIDKGGRLDHGMYEPFLICDDNGDLVCFYSDETEVDDVHGQRLVFRVSSDGINWGEKKYVCAPEDRHLRPGMIIVTRLGSGKYFCAYEVCAIEGNPIYYKISDSLTEWKEPEKLGEMIETTDGKVFGSTPYCEWMPYGEQGALIVTAHHMAKGTSRTGTDLFVSFDEGKTWKNYDNPLPYILTGKCHYSYSPALLLSSDKSFVYYANAVNCENNTETFERAQYSLTKISFE